jgi:hypothetical protein
MLKLQACRHMTDIREGMQYEHRYKKAHYLILKRMLSLFVVSETKPDILVL